MNLSSALKNTINNLTAITANTQENTIEPQVTNIHTVNNTHNKPSPSIWNLGHMESILKHSIQFQRESKFSNLFNNENRLHYKYKHIYINPTSNCGFGKRFSINLPKYNEVDIVQNPVIVLEGSSIKTLSKMYNKEPNGIKDLTWKIVKKCELEIGGSRIINLYNIGFDFFSKKNNYDMYQTVNQKYAMTTGKLYVSIPFTLLINEGYLPIMLLEHHSVKIHLELESITNLTKGNQYLINLIDRNINCQLKLDAIYLPPNSYDISKPKNILYNNYQYTGPEIVNKKETINKFKLYFNHMVNGMFMCFTHGEYNELVRDDYIFDNLKVVVEDTILLDIPYEVLKSEGLYHAGIKNDSETDGYFWVPFSRINESINNNIQSMGAINMTTLNNVTIAIQFNENINKYDRLNIHIMGTHYDLLRMMSGMAGLAFSK